MLVGALMEGGGGGGGGGVGVGRIGAVLGTVLLALGYGTWRMRTLPVRDVGVVGLVQPNEGYREKWDSLRQDSVFGRLLGLSERLRTAARLDLLIWPEAAVPGYFIDHPEWDAAVARRARETGTPILTGGLDAAFHDDRSYDYYNSAFFYDATGNRAPYPVYHKHYLVPIVERVPFLNPRWFGNLKWFGGFGKGRGLPLYPTALGRFGVLICYESVFEDLARTYRRGGADFLVNVTNDAWYGRTAGPYQHAAHLVLRAVETRMGIARAANSGISGTVDPLGRYHDTTGLEVETADAAGPESDDHTGRPRRRDVSRGRSARDRCYGDRRAGTRHDHRDQRPARASRRTGRAGHDAGVRGSAVAAAPGARIAVRSGTRSPASARRARARGRRRGAHGPPRCARAARRSRGRAGGGGGAHARPGGGGRGVPVRVPAPRARAPGGDGAAGRARRYPRDGEPRSASRLPRVRAHQHYDG